MGFSTTMDLSMYTTTFYASYMQNRTGSPSY